MPEGFEIIDIVTRIIAANVDILSHVDRATNAVTGTGFTVRNRCEASDFGFEFRIDDPGTGKQVDVFSNRNLRLTVGADQIVQAE